MRRGLCGESSSAQIAAGGQLLVPCASLCLLLGVALHRAAVSAAHQMVFLSFVAT